MSFLIYREVDMKTKQYGLALMLMLVATGAAAGDSWQTRCKALYESNQASGWQQRMTAISHVSQEPTWQQRITELSLAKKEPTWQQKITALYEENR
jgi:hypothetical protein